MNKHHKTKQYVHVKLFSSEDRDKFERALERFRKKVLTAGTFKKLRESQFFTPDSDKKRIAKHLGKYREKKRLNTKGSDRSHIGSKAIRLMK
jgi:ribosomal protein S21